MSSVCCLSTLRLDTRNEDHGRKWVVFGYQRTTNSAGGVAVVCFSSVEFEFMEWKIDSLTPLLLAEFGCLAFLGRKVV